MHSSKNTGFPSFTQRPNCTKIGPRRAVDTLNVVRPFDWAAPDALAISTLFPAYERGQAYLAAGEGGKAAAELQKLIDHPGMVLNFPLGALARLGLARAYAMQRDTPKLPLRTKISSRSGKTLTEAFLSSLRPSLNMPKLK